MSRTAPASQSAGQTSSEPPGDVGTAVAGAVADHDDVEGPVTLRQDRSQRRFGERLAVEQRENHADFDG
jgi:hypothetical protein